MSSTATEGEVVQRVLESFQRELRSLRGGWILQTFMGEPPAEGFARHLSEVDEKGRTSGNVRGVWRIAQTEIVALPASFTIPPAGRTSGMYYDTAAFDFVVAPDGTSVVVGWQVGPRFGRGVRYQVVTDDAGNPSLRLADTLWKS
jgi:hypothetical protein